MSKKTKQKTKVPEGLSDLSRLEEIRKERGLSIERVARKLGVSAMTVMRWRSGLTKTPNPLAAKAVRSFIEGYDQAKAENTVAAFLG